MKNILLAFVMVLGAVMALQAQDAKPVMSKKHAEKTMEKATPATPAIKVDMSKMEAKPAKDGEGPVMDFETLIVDYGTIEQNSDKVRYLKFTNTGTEPLVISNARGSCGCTVPDWPKNPIMPGEEDVIKVSYATNRLGKINKTITLTTNETGKPHVIKVIGFVNEKEEGLPEAPQNVLGGGK